MVAARVSRTRSVPTAMKLPRRPTPAPTGRGGVRGALFYMYAVIAIGAVAVATAQQCDDSCVRAINGRCDEGRSCAAGTDCTDCGGRAGLPPGTRTDPRPPPEPESEPSGLTAGELPPPATVLSQQMGLLVVVGFGAAFTLLTRFVTQLEAKRTGKTEMSSEQFNTGGRDVGIGLTAAKIVSSWTWAATLLQSSNVGWKYGISGPFWYASGATIQVLLFAILAIQVKRRCPVMRTYLEVILLRWGSGAHKIFMCFALVCNCIVSAMLLLGGAATIQQLTGLSTNWSCFLIPIGVLFYTYSGGLKATFFASYIHTCIIFTVLVVFVFTAYATPAAPEVGSASAMYDSLWRSALLCRSTGGVGYDYPDGLLDNQGVCVARTDGGEVDLASTMDVASGSCAFVRCAEDATDGCGSDPARALVDQSGHQWEERGCAVTEVCVGSFATMSSTGGLTFGVVNIVGNFGTVFIDQAYWQSAVAAQPSATVTGFLVGGLVWFAVPFCMATTFGLAGRALSSSGRVPITFEQADAGLVPAIVITDLMGTGGAFALLTMLFMAVTSTGSAELIAVSSILTYDLFWTYLLPELREAVVAAGLRYRTSVAAAQPHDEMALSLEEVGRLLVELRANRWLRDGTVSPEDIEMFSQGRATAQTAHREAELQRRGVGGIEAKTAGEILVRISRFFTVLFGGFMGFLAVLLEGIGLSLGYVYMAMGIMIGSAVVPVSCALLLESANGTACTAGAVIGLCIAVATWLYVACINDINGEISLASTGGQYPLLFGNIMALLSGGVIAIGGSLVWPDDTFKWADLGAIESIDDVLPPPAVGEDDASLLRESNRAKKQTGMLSIILVAAWPMPMYLSGSVMSKTAFTLWIGLACVWAVVAAFVITLLPPGEEFLRKGTNKEPLPPVQLEPVVLQEATENPAAAAAEGTSSRPDSRDEAEGVLTAATSFLQRRQQHQQQQQMVDADRGGFSPEEAEL